MKKKSLAILLCLVMAACTFDQVLADINLLIQIAGAIIPALGAISPADAALASQVSQIASTGLAVVKTDYDAYKASGAVTDLQKLQAAINAVNSNLASALAAAHIVDPVVQQRVTAWANLISVTLNAILAALPPAPVVAGKAKLVAPIPTTGSIKLQWKASVCRNDAACAGLVK